MTSVFDGTWRPRYGAPGADEPPDERWLEDGIFECRSCRPPFRVPADGRPHPVADNPRFETLEIDVDDARTVRHVGRRADAVVYRATLVVSDDGNTMVEMRTVAEVAEGVLVPVVSALRDGSGTEPPFVLFQIRSVRIGAPAAGAHLVSGTWRVLDRDLVDHDEDTVYEIVDDTIAMRDRLGRSYRARLDGTVAPYLGDARFTGVSVRRLDDWTIEESNLHGDDVIQVATWRVDPDGRTMHVRFDDLKGHSMEQVGDRID